MPVYAGDFGLCKKKPSGSNPEGKTAYYSVTLVPIMVIKPISRMTPAYNQA